MFAQRLFNDIRPTAGTIFRIGVDVVSIWVAIAIGWAIALGSEWRVPADHFLSFAAIAAGLSIVHFLIYADAGLYSALNARSLGSKLWSTLMANLKLFAIVATTWLIASQVVGVATGSPSTIIAFCAVAFFFSAVLATSSRIASFVLRSDEQKKPIPSYRLVGDESRVLVIGGCGYIGSVLVEKLLDKGQRVLVLDAMHFGEEPLAKVAHHPNLKIIREDFRRVEALTRAMEGVGSVIHLGGLVGDPACAIDPDLTIDVNVTATKLVGEIAKAQGVRRFVFASSCSIYGACDEIVDEQSQFNPQSLYARTKVASEAVLASLNDRNFAVTCLRFATVYGISGRARFDLVVNLLCAKAVRDGVITVFGPDQWRPFVHVEDVATAVAMVLEAPLDRVAGEAFNVGSDGQNFTIGRAAEMIGRQVADAQISVDEGFEDTRNYRVSFGKIRTRLGFEPKWTLEQGISQVVAAVRSNRLGHYSLSTYSNALHLKQRGSESFESFQITGWESKLMNISELIGAQKEKRTAVE